MGKLVFGTVYHNGYKVSTKAKTLFDCAYNIHYVEDIGPLLDLIHDMNGEDFTELLKYLHLVQTSSIIQRIGVILEKADAPKKTLSEIKKLCGKSIIRLDKKDKRYIKYDRKWKVFDNINIDRFLR
jgi:predicted transcriptional regulator of viral defense system